MRSGLRSSFSRFKAAQNTRKGVVTRHIDLGCDTSLQARAHIKNKCCRELDVAAVRAAALHKPQALVTVLVNKNDVVKQTDRHKFFKIHPSSSCWLLLQSAQFLRGRPPSQKAFTWSVRWTKSDRAVTDRSNIPTVKFTDRGIKMVQHTT